MDSPLQKFDFRNSLYERPDKDWVCGRAADGNACQIGPDKGGHCRATAECVPMREGDRWRCKRSAFYGGTCAEGPNPDGSCCRTIPPCQPVRSWRARRGVAVRWTVGLTLGLLLIIFSLPERLNFLSPGELSQGHAALAHCDTCHSSAGGGIRQWIGAAVGDFDHSSDSAQCSGCHEMGPDALAAHSVNPDVLAALTAEMTPSSSAPLTIKVAAALMTQEHIQGDGLACSSCHSEHHGSDADIAAFSDANCVTCHQVKFGQFSDGHPPFSGYPNDRRTHLFFDHVSHIDKHFADEDNQALAPNACNDCHVTQTGGGRMVLKPYEETCNSCHGGQIAGDGRATAKGIAVLGLPGLDVSTLIERGIGIGQWPEFAEEELSAFMRSLLAAKEEFAEHEAALGDLDLLDLTDADDAQLGHVAALAWMVKELFYDLESRGTAALAEHLAETLGELNHPAQHNELLAALPPDMVEAARLDWFPSLLEEVQRHAAGQDVDSVVVEAPIKAKKPTTDDDGDEDFDALFGDDGADEDTDEDFDALFGDGDGGDGNELDISASDDDDDDVDETESSEFEYEDPRIGVEDRAGAGGWYREDYQLRYRPVGHADSFIRSWIEASASSEHVAVQGIFKELTRDGAPGACGKCHSVDEVDGERIINWQVRQADPNHKQFNRFSHRAHFNLLDQEGCMTCHAFNKESDYASSFDDTDPHTFASNFHSLSAETCAQCHQEGKAGESCVSCHNYHVVEIKPAMLEQHSLSTENKQ
jgi:hypothetical protein